MKTNTQGAETMTTFLAYNMNTNRICGFVRAKSKRAAVWAFKRQRYFEGRCFGGKFGIQTMSLSEWDEDGFERSGGFAIPRPADVQTDLITAFGWDLT
jgi:hypothetical protein